MAVPKGNRRSVLDIRTHSGTVDQVSVPSKMHLRIACLEMEKERRGRERDSAMHRVKNIDARCRDIEAEKTALLSALGAKEGGPPRTPRAASAGRNPGGFRVNY